MPSPAAEVGSLRRVVAAAALSLVITLVAGCRRGDADEVVLYVSADEHLARSVVRRFEAETGLRVLLVTDTEAKKTTGLVERLRAERDHPQADVFWSSEVFMTIDLADEGVLAPYRSPATAVWPRSFRDDDDRWYGFAARARVIVYAPGRVSHDEIPATWTDLTQPRYRGRIAMADPRFGTTGGHLGAMKAYWDRVAMPGYYEAFLLGLRANGVRLLPSGNAGVVQAILDGDADVGLTDTDDVWAAQARGLDVALVFPDHTHEPIDGNGTLLIPNTVGRVRGGPNPEGAGRLIEFLLSADVERMLAESTSGNVPLGPDRADATGPVVDPMEVDLRRAAAARRTAVAMAMRILTGAGAPAEHGATDAG